MVAAAAGKLKRGLLQERTGTWVLIFDPEQRVLWFFRPLPHMHNANDIDLVFEDVVDEASLEYLADIDIVRRFVGGSSGRARNALDL